MKKYIKSLIYFPYRYCFINFSLLGVNFVFLCSVISKICCVGNSYGRHATAFLQGLRWLCQNFGWEEFLKQIIWWCSWVCAAVGGHAPSVALSLEPRCAILG